MEKLQARINSNEDYKKVIGKGELWTDPHFPHDNSVLQGIDGKFNWLRASQIFNGREKVFDSFSGDDIEQGSLGDCYLLSAISALAEFPGRVEKLFPQKERNVAGCYVVKLYICGQQVEIVVDDYFPVDQYKRPAFAGSKGQELWVMLVEKAWAKIHGNFSRIEGGDSRESLAAITGAPVYYHKHSEMKPHELWEMIKTFDKSNFIMCTGANRDIRGIVKGHAYTLINAYEFDLNGEDVKLIQIRNPWGCTEWEGAWSDKDPRWTAEMNRRLNHTSKDDGTFFMPFKDFSEIFIHTFVAKVNDEYIYSNLFISDQKAFATFDIRRHTKGFVSAHQVTKRLGATVVSDYGIERLKIELYKLVGNDLVLIKDGWNNAVGPAYLDVILEPGTYVVKAAFLSDSRLPYITFVGYAEKQIDFVQLKIKDLREATPEKIKEALSTLKVAYGSTTTKLAGAFQTCLLGHALEWSTALSETGKLYICENCRQPNNVEAGRWLCKPCLYDICGKCRPQEIAKVSKAEEDKSVKCSAGHGMTFGISKENTGLYLCDKCGKAYFNEVDRWMCNACGMDLCRGCVAPPAEFKQEGEIPEIDTCPKGHKLEFIVSETLKGRYECDICAKLGDSHNGRWACLACGINVCHICKPCEGAKKGAVTAKTKTLVCNKGHILMFACYTPPPGSAISCDKCRGQVSSDNWRWSCRKCEFDVCTKCRAEPEGRRDLICPNMHKMLYSVLPQGRANYGRCDICHKVFKLVSGRYCCSACEYECCNNCVSMLSKSKRDREFVWEKSAPSKDKKEEKTDAESSGEKDKPKEKREGCCCSIL